MSGSGVSGSGRGGWKGREVKGVLMGLRDSLEDHRQHAVLTEEAAAADFEELRATKLESIDALAAQARAGACALPTEEIRRGDICTQCSYFSERMRGALSLIHI